jgi:hypothetical protein
MRELRAWMVGCLCAVGSALAAGCASAPQGQAWLEVRTPHFDMHTDLLEPAALDMARALEEARAGLITVAWKGAPDPRGRTQVVVFAREGRFHDYVPREETAGLAQSLVGSERIIVIYWDDERPSGLPPVAVHEIAHDLSHWFAPLQPAWYSEGMACFLEGLAYDRATQRAILGGIPEPMVRVLTRVGRSASSSEGLFSARSAIHEDAEKTSHFYFTSWLLVHYLINHHGEPFIEFQRDLSQLRDWRESWSTRFSELAPARLDAGLEQYLDGGRFEYIAAKVAVPPFSPRVRTLSPAQGHGLSSWVAHRLGARELSERDRDLALALDPQELNALRTRYHGLSRTSQAGERLSLARQLARLHPESGEAWLLLADSGESEEERRGALDQATRLMPDHPGVVERLAARALEARDAAAALRHTRLLIRRTALAPSVAILHLKALTASGRCDAAQHFAKSSSASYPGGCVIQKQGKRVPCLTHFEDVIRETCQKALAEPTDTKRP